MIRFTKHEIILKHYALNYVAGIFFYITKGLKRASFSFRSHLFVI